MSKPITVSDNTKAKLEYIKKGIPKGKFLKPESMDSIVSRLLDKAGVPKEVPK